MTLIQCLQRASRILREDRDALQAGHANPSTGKVDDAGAAAALQEIDEVLVYFDNLLRHAESEACHV